MTEKRDDGLRGVCVLVTRPRSQADELCAQILARGGTALQVPAIEIAGPSGRATRELEVVARDFEHQRIVIFISANAVQWGLRWLDDARLRLGAATRVGAVGESTARALREHGIAVDFVPHGRFDSEGLLALDALQDLKGQRVLIVRGEGGREKLADTLTQRGASVTYAEVYRRQKPAACLSRALSEAQRDSIDVIVVTSNEGIQNLYDMADEAWRSWLLSRPLVALSERAVTLARSLGFSNKIRVAAQANDTAIAAALETWANEQK